MKRAVLFLCLLLSPLLAHADGGIRVTDAWMRTPAKGQRAGAIYLKIVNDGKTEDVLTAAESPAAQHTELHSMAMDNGIMRMRRLENLPIPAGGAQILSPANIHLMLIDLKDSFKEGDTVPLTLTFQKAGEVKATAYVRPLAE